MRCELTALGADPDMTTVLGLDIDVEGLDSARDRHAHRVAHEGSHVMVLQKSRILGKNRTFLRLFNIWLLQVLDALE